SPHKNTPPHHPTPAPPPQRTGAVFPTGGIGGRLGRHSDGGAKNYAQQKKKKKKKLCFFLAGQSFFCAPLYISISISISNIRVKKSKTEGVRTSLVRTC